MEGASEIRRQLREKGLTSLYCPGCGLVHMWVHVGRETTCPLCGTRFTVAEDGGVRVL